MPHNSKNTRDFILIAISVALLWGCAGRPVDTSEERTLDDVGAASKEQKIETLSAALSKAQSRIEELDAKVMALTDKLESTKLTLENITGNKPISVQPVGALTKEDDAVEAHAPTNTLHPAPEHATTGNYEAPVATFNKALQLFKGGKYTDAVLSFNHVTENYPDHILAGSAQFYAGEAYFMLGEYKLALNEYRKVTSSFSSSPRVASALVRMSHCYAAVGSQEEADRTMALAKDLYEGNPSLEWPGASGVKSEKTRATAANKAELSSTPIEPAQKTEHGESSEHHN